MKIRIEDHGSICLFRPLDSEAKRILHQTAPEEAQFMGTAMAVEPRYSWDVKAALEELGVDFQ